MDVFTSSTPATSLNEIASQKPSRKNIYIIFIEFSSSETNATIAYLREHKFSPRGRNISSLNQLLEALSERAWDIIICKEQQGSFDPFAMSKKLHALEKDIPILMLSGQCNQKLVTQAMHKHIQAVIPSTDLSLLVLHITREYAHLETRRQARRMQLQLSEYHKRSQLLMDRSEMAICFIHNQKIIYLNDAFCKLFGYEVKDQLINKTLLNFIAPQERNGVNQLIADFLDSGLNKQPYQLLAKRFDESNFTVHLALQQADFKGTDCIEIAFETNSSLSSKSKFDDLDPITGLYNLDYFSNTLENNLRLAQRGGNDCQLIYIDILNLPNIKSLLGNEASKMMARDVTDILNEMLSRSHLKARIGEQLFCAIYSDPDTDKVALISNKILQRLKSHISKVDDQTIAIECAIAIVPINETTASVKQVFSRADEAIEQCLSQDTEQVYVYDIEKSTEQQDQIQSIAQATHAIENDKLRLLFQPLVPLVFATDQQHYEVLVRMIGSNNENILPANFFASMEFANLNEQMDRWVIKNSIQQLRQQLDNHQQTKLFINITETIWEHEELLLWFADLLRDSRIPADRIVIQISETESANALSRAKHFADGLRRLNCLVCLKHYGSTNESQQILKTLNPDFIKFDPSYLRELSEDSHLNEHLQHLLADLTNLGKITIVPQVETPKVMSMLWKSGVGMVQGYYLQAPDISMSYDFGNN